MRIRLLWAVVLVCLAPMAQAQSLWPDTKVQLTTEGKTLRAAIDAGDFATTTHDPCEPGVIGTIRGGGAVVEDGITTYAWTCANYPHSSEVGGVDASGVSDYNTATTVGGNSWEMDCIGDGDATDDPAEELACAPDMIGRTVRMYSDADWILGLDRLRPGGTMYVPAGLYHEGFCGQDENAVANNCPVTRNDPEVHSRMWELHHGKRIVASSGLDPTGDEDGVLDGAWLILDHGDDENATYVDAGGPSHTGQMPRWLHRIGRYAKSQITPCKNDGTIPAVSATKAGCEAEGDAVALTGGSLANPWGSWGRRAIIPGGTYHRYNAANLNRICIDNTIAQGVCRGDVRLACNTATPSSARTGDYTGGCVVRNAADDGTIDLGPCEGLADTLDNLTSNTDDEPNDLWVSVQEGSSGTIGDADGDGNSYHTLSRPNFVSGACGTGSIGLWAYFTDDSETSSRTGYPAMHLLDADWDIRAGTELRFVTSDNLWNHGAVVEGLNMRPANWLGRDSTNDAADCLVATDTACDSGTPFSLGASLGASGWRGNRLTYGNGEHGAQSLIDGTPLQPGMFFERNILDRPNGLLSDLSEVLISENIVIRGIGGGAAFAIGFGGPLRLQDNWFIQSRYERFAKGQNGGGAIVTGNRFMQTRFSVSPIITDGFRQAVFRDNHFWGLYAECVITIAAEPSRDAGQVTIEGTSVYNHQNPDRSSQPNATICVTDRSVTNDGGDVWAVTVRDTYDNVDGDTGHIGLFLDGGDCSEDSVFNGQGRNVCKWRNGLTVENLNVEVWDDGSPVAFKAVALGNTDGGGVLADAADDAGILDFWDAAGPMPKWENISMQTEGIDEVFVPDLQDGIIAAADAPDCDEMLSGQTVTIHDDTTAVGTCAHTGGVLDGGGAIVSPCKCDGAGNYVSAITGT